MPWWFWVIVGSIIYVAGYGAFLYIGTHMYDDEIRMAKDSRAEAESAMKEAMLVSLVWPVLLILGGPIFGVMAIHEHLVNVAVRRVEKKAVK